MLTRSSIVAVCALLVLTAGCSSGSDKADPPTTTKAPTSTAPVRTTTSTAPTTSTTSTTLPPSPLAALMVTDAPSQFPREPDEYGDTGPTDLEKAVRDDALSLDARPTLVSNGFVHGYQRQWSSNSGVDQNFLYVYEFATPEGAQAYLSHWQQVASVSGTTRAPPVPFTPLAPPGAIGLSAGDNRGTVAIVMVAKGPYAVQALVTGGPGKDQTFPASALALAQYSKLP